MRSPRWQRELAWALTNRQQPAHSDLLVCNWEHRLFALARIVLFRNRRENSMLLLIILVVLLFGGGGGYYGYSRWGNGGGIGIVGLVLIIVLIVYALGGVPLGR